MDKNLIRNMPDGFLSVRYLGQAGFLLQSGGVSVVIDPYLSDSVDRSIPNAGWKRKYPAPIKPEDLRDADIVLLTHSHLDHTDPDTAEPLYQAGSSLFIAPHEVVGALKSRGFSDSRVVALDDLQSMNLKSTTVTAIAAAHEELHFDLQGHICELSYHITFPGGISVFAGGDMSFYPGLPEKIPRSQLAFLPINGRSFQRAQAGIIGNLTFDEAADLSALLEVNMVIPSHFDLYDINGCNPAWFADYMETHHPGRAYHIMQPGEQFIFAPDSE
ncbi:MAG TPA: MBL fold metallo-hydrolase [Oscillospiraceae bacterium]|nr:MBL fold metallo-hydrolase [Oscillospiraceae bacterium]HPS35719.1 MBL fold metallo-hydrolase [Oscillospiraceae bacterium]